jgi:nicotinamide phosphoribosyltransferase
MNSLLLTDFYKIGHVFQYPKNTTKVYSNFTARGSRIEGVNSVIFFGLQYFIKKYLMEEFQKNFFEQPLEKILHDYKRTIKNCLGCDLHSYVHIENLHNLGYLPIEIKALPEGSIVPIKVPMFTIENTLPDFYWVTNFLETLISANLWQAITSATIANEYYKILKKWANKTGLDEDFLKFQAHDFSFRGMSSLESAITSGMGHLTSFSGTDTIPAILAIENYYNVISDNYLIGASIPATEHSVMCSATKDNELETFKRLINDVYPNGYLSIVSDTWDLWKVCTEYLPALKQDILTRNGKVVIRPDSGDPVDIICGLKTNGVLEDDKTSNLTPQQKGVIELLWDVFGGHINEQGYKVLANHIGAIYGDSITLARANEICARLEAKGFASQCVFGIGSYTYQYNTRDTFNMAMKSTYIEINGVGQNIQKDPITDSGTKKSAIGLLKVELINGHYSLKDSCAQEDLINCELKTVFKDGSIHQEENFEQIRMLIKDKARF